MVNVSHFASAVIAILLAACTAGAETPSHMATPAVPAAATASAEAIAPVADSAPAGDTAGHQTYGSVLADGTFAVYANY